ncbi:MAG TPA: high-affinity iron transporter [Candidatus Methanoperedenaceae archaeon]|nr:high-affinity iron transporter [Candidatus Methanoperedenaceae archaeon]
MLESFIIMLREGLEAALIIGIVHAYLKKIGRADLHRHLYAGTALAIAASLLAGAAFMLAYEGTGEAGPLFEGVSSLIASFVLTYMIFWMTGHARKIAGELREKVDMALSTGQVAGIVMLAFIAVFREGIETVLFLGTLAVKAPLDTAAGTVLGIATVVLLFALMSRGMYMLDIQKLFRYTSILLIIFAAGLAAYGVHELNEAGIIPPVIEHVWDINPPLNPDGSYPPLHENGIVGSFLKALVGYNGNPSLTEVIAYVGYWVIAGTYLVLTYRRR